MWKHKLQAYNKLKTSKSESLSPFATQSSPQTSSPLISSTSSPRNETKLPSGVRYIRQTPNSIYRSVPTPTSHGSPTKKLRFADQLMSVRNDVKSDSQKSSTITATKQLSSGKSRIVRPVFSQGFVDKKSPSKPCSKTYAKTVALSPASRSRSPIFSTVDFGSHSKNNDLKSLASSPKSNSNVISSSGDYNENRKSSPLQSKAMIEIKTPKGTIKRSTLLLPNKGSDGVERNTLSFEHPIEFVNNKNSKKTFAVNVNVAVGVDCDENVLKQTNSNVNQINNNNFNNNRLTDDLQMNSNDLLVRNDYSDGISSSLKVAVRLRPFLQNEIDSYNDNLVIDIKGNTVRVINSDNENYNKLEFGFDLCLNSSDRDLFDYADQDTVYRKLGEPLLDCSLEGYNVCLFAYGQTSSGKSYTMMGTESIPGIIPRFVNELFKKIVVLNDRSVAVRVNYFEVYNEKIYDLLSEDRINYNKKTLRVREHPQTGPYVEDLSVHFVESYEEVMELLLSGKSRRATASTAANDESSRSHSIFTIFLSQHMKSDDLMLEKSFCTSNINLVDLAGSERVGVSGTSGERLKEGTLINKSLLTLGKVISQLAEKGAHNKNVHIPYRDSVLTWLLKESLGGNSRTSMIATISPAKCHLEETLSTLRYAAIARRIVNFVRINEDPNAKKIRELMEEIAILKQQNIISNDNNIIDEKTTQSSSKDNESNHKEMCNKTTETSFSLSETPNKFDLMRTQLLEEQQRSLLDEIRKQKLIIFPEVPQKSNSELLKQIYDLFEEVLNKSTFELEDIIEEPTLVDNTSNSSHDSNAWPSD